MVGLHSSRLTLESNYNDRRRNPSLGRGSFLERRAGLGGGAAEYAYAQPVPVLLMIFDVASIQLLARTSRLVPHAPTHRNNPICKNPPFSRTAVGLYGGGDGGVDFPTLFISVSFCLGTGWTYFRACRDSSLSLLVFIKFLTTRGRYRRPLSDHTLYRIVQCQLHSPRQRLCETPHFHSFGFSTISNWMYFVWMPSTSP